MEESGITINEEQGFRKPTILQVSIFYVIEMCIFIVFSLLISKVWPKSLSMSLYILVTQVLLIFVPPLIFLKIFKYDLKKILRIKKVNILVLINAIAIAFFAIFLTSFLNFIYMYFYAKFIGKIDIPQIPMAEGSRGFLINILVIAVVPAVFEEILFRGAIQRGFEGLGYAKAALISGILFAIMHLNQYQFLGLMLLGFLIGFLVYRTDSIFVGMTVHFINNAFAVSIQFLYSILGKYVNIENKSSDINKALEAVDYKMMLVIIFLILVLASIVGGLIVLLMYLTKNVAEKRKT